jgi:opacity protein-like surface antigen
MKKTVFVCALAASALALASARAAVAADNWIGTWNLNVAKSKFKPGPPLKSQTLKFETAAEGIKLTSDGVDADGTATHGEYTAKFDGTDTPWSGNPNADTASPKRIDADHYRNTWKKGGKVTVTADVMVSKDGKTLTVTQTGKDAKGRAMNTVEVFDRQ